MKYGTGEHTADLVLWVESANREGLFRDAPLALAELMVEGPRKGPVRWRKVRLEGRDRAELMVRLLNEVVYLLEAENLLAAEHEIRQVGESRLESRLGLVEPDPGLNSFAEPVKAVTYHEAKVAKRGNTWRMKVILDV